MNPKWRKSVRSLKSWLFTPGSKAYHFEKAAEVGADALIIDLEDAVAPSAKQEARCAALHYLEGLGSDRTCRPCFSRRINHGGQGIAFDLKLRISLCPK